jgi:NAD(P)H-dependent FMN reductase
MADEVLLLCGSIKPPPGSTTPSAARELLRVVEGRLRDLGHEPAWLDLRDLDLPMFDGRRLEEYDAPDLLEVAKRISTAGTCVLSVPAYWSGPSGVMKNLLDLLGGPDYRTAKEPAPRPFEDKVCALLVIGADDASACNASTALRAILAHLGAWVAPRAFVVGNPRQIADRQAFLRGLRDFASYIAERRGGAP